MFYGLTVNPVNSEVYVADAIDYVQPGVILRYSPEGELLDEFKVGIIPGHFVGNNNDEYENTTSIMFDGSRCYACRLQQR